MIHLILSHDESDRTPFLAARLNNLVEAAEFVAKLEDQFAALTPADLEAITDRVNDANPLAYYEGCEVYALNTEDGVTYHFNDEESWEPYEPFTPDANDVRAYCSQCGVYEDEGEQFAVVNDRFRCGRC